MNDKTPEHSQAPNIVSDSDSAKPSSTNAIDDSQVKVKPGKYRVKQRKRRFSVKEALFILAAVCTVVLGVDYIFKSMKGDQKPEVLIVNNTEVASGVRLNRNAVLGEKITAEMVSVGPDDGGAFKIAEDVIGDCISDNLPKGSRLTLENVGPCP